MMVDLYINKTRDEQLEDFYFRSSHNHEPLNELTPKEKSDYESRDSWTWIEAIYILNGFKPIFQTSTKPMLLRFSKEISYFSEALARGDIGKMELLIMKIPSKIGWSFGENMNG